MNSKSLIYLGIFVGSAVGSYIPVLWGASLFSFSSIIFSAVGALAGLYVAFKVASGL